MPRRAGGRRRCRLAIAKAELECGVGRGAVPGRQVDLGGEGAAGRRGRQRAALAFAEVDLEVGVGQLRQVVEGGDRGGRCRGRRRACPATLTRTPALGDLGDQVERRSGVAERDCRRARRGRARLRPVSSKSGLWTVKSPIFEPFGQPAPGRRGDRLGRVLGGGADAEAGADRGVDRHPFGQRHHRLARPARERQPLGVERGRLLSTSRLKSKPLGEEARGLVEQRQRGRARSASDAAALEARRRDEARGLTPAPGCCQEVAVTLKASGPSQEVGRVR